MKQKEYPSIRHVSWLFRFMLVFRIDRFSILEVTGTKVRALIGWPDDGSGHYERDLEVQEIQWDAAMLICLDDALSVSEYLVEENLLRNDLITSGRNDLVEKIRSRMNWSQDRSKAAVATLLSIEVDMLDEGRKTDKFFLHF